MRLFGIVDGTIDRFDRAGWLTPPFDLAWAAPVAVMPPYCVEAAHVYVSGTRRASIHAAGSRRANVFTGGAERQHVTQ